MKNSIFDDCVNMDYEKIWEAIECRQHTVECDDRSGILHVTTGFDGDMHISLSPASQTQLRPSFRSRTGIGGGKNQRIRKALILLALAIHEDVEIKNIQ